MVRPETGYVLANSGYRLKNPITAGPFGERWALDDPAFAADLVVCETDDYMRALCRNAEVMKGLTNSPAVINIVEAGWLDDDTYFQILDRDSDAEALSVSDSILSEDQLWPLTSALVDGLVHLHRREIVHGALSPDVLYSDGDRLRIGDLWWAHTADGVAYHKPLSEFLPHRMPLSIAQYMAPEVLAGQPPDRLSDIFSLAATLFYLLCGEAPRDVFPIANEDDYRLALRHCPITPLEFLIPDFDESTAGLLHRMMSEDRSQRPSILELDPLVQYLCNEPVFG